MYFKLLSLALVVVISSSCTTPASPENNTDDAVKLIQDYEKQRAAPQSAPTLPAPDKFDAKAVYNAALEKLAETHPALANPTVRSAFVQRWKRSDASLAMLTSEETADAEIEKMVTAAGFALYSKYDNANQDYDNGAGVQISLGFSPKLRNDKALLAKLPKTASVADITAALRISQDHPLEIGSFSSPSGFPFQQIGVSSNDTITAIDGQKLDGMTLAQAMALFSPADGRRVEMEVLRAYPKGRTDKITVGLQRQIVLPVELTELESGIHLLRIRHAFTEYQSLMAIIADALTRASSGKGLIVDLRSLRGDYGELGSSLAEFFLREGASHTRKFRIGDSTAYTEFHLTPELLVVRQPLGSYRDPGAPIFSYQERNYRAILPASMPVVVLINGETSAPGEDLAAILKNNGRATIIGTATTIGGKSKMTLWRQELPCKRYLYVPQDFYMPGGSDVDKWNYDVVTPHIVVQPNGTSDNQLEVALTELKKKLPR